MSLKHQWNMIKLSEEGLRDNQYSTNDQIAFKNLQSDVTEKKSDFTEEKESQVEGKEMSRRNSGSLRITLGRTYPVKKGDSGIAQHKNDFIPRHFTADG